MSAFHEAGPVSLHLSGLKFISKCRSSVADQSIRVARHPTLGKILFIGDEIQHVERWAPIYHEHLVHLSASFVPKIRSALILGGGSLFAAKEVLKYDSIETITQVDHDRNVISMVRKHYDHAESVLSDKRFKIVNQDAFEFALQTDCKYDLVVNDAMDLYNYASKPVERYKLLSRKLAADGVCCDVVYRHVFEKKTTQAVMRLLNRQHHCAFSLVAIPEYPGILHLLSIWGNAANISQQNTRILNFEQSRWAKSGVSPFVWYSPSHKGFYLYLPPYIKTLLKGSSTNSEAAVSKASARMRKDHEM